MSDYRWTWLDRVEAEDSPASPGARHLANVLVRHFVPKGQDVCWPGKRRLNALMGVGRDTVQYRFDELEHYGFLLTTRRENGKSHLRQLLIPESFSTGVPSVPVRKRGGRQTGVPWVPVSTPTETEITGVPWVPDRRAVGTRTTYLNSTDRSKGRYAGARVADEIGECVLCGSRYDSNHTLAELVRCPACVGVRKGIVTESEAKVMRFRQLMAVVVAPGDGATP